MSGQSELKTAVTVLCGRVGSPRVGGMICGRCPACRPGYGLDDFTEAITVAADLRYGLDVVLDEAVAWWRRMLATARLSTQVAICMAPLLCSVIEDDEQRMRAVIDDVVSRWRQAVPSSDGVWKLLGGLDGEGFIVEYIRDVEGGQDSEQPASILSRGNGGGLVDDELTRIWAEHVDALLDVVSSTPAPVPPSAGDLNKEKQATELRHDVYVEGLRTSVALWLSNLIFGPLDKHRGWITAVVSDVVDQWLHSPPEVRDRMPLPGSHAFPDHYYDKVMYPAGEEVCLTTWTSYLPAGQPDSSDVYDRQVWQHHARALVQAAGSSGHQTW